MMANIVRLLPDFMKDTRAASSRHCRKYKSDQMGGQSEDVSDRGYLSRFRKLFRWLDLNVGARFP